MTLHRDADVANSVRDMFIPATAQHEATLTLECLRFGISKVQKPKIEIKLSMLAYGNSVTVEVS